MLERVFSMEPYENDSKDFFCLGAGDYNRFFFKRFWSEPHSCGRRRKNHYSLLLLVGKQRSHCQRDTAQHWRGTATNRASDAISGSIQCLPGGSPQGSRRRSRPPSENRVPHVCAGHDRVCLFSNLEWNHTHADHYHVPAKFF